MFKGMFGAFVVIVLAGCGGGGPSSGSEAVVDSNLTEDVDPYLGKWGRNCVPSNPFEVFGIPVKIDGGFEDEAIPVYTKEELKIEMDSMSLSMEFFSDELCAEPHPILSIFDQVLGLSNLGGEIQARDEWVSKNGYDFVRYSIPVGFLAVESLPIGLHNVDDRLYIVAPFEVTPFHAVEEDYVVDFNKYYTREMD